jgi:hypothetical protein
MFSLSRPFAGVSEMPDATLGTGICGMSAVLKLATSKATQADVECAQAAHFALIRAEVDDPRLLDDLAHQQAKDQAREKYLRLYDEWSRE